MPRSEGLLPSSAPFLLNGSMIFSPSSSDGCCRQPSGALKDVAPQSLRPSIPKAWLIGYRDTVTFQMSCNLLSSGTSVPTCSLLADVLQRLEFTLDVTSGPFHWHSDCSFQTTTTPRLNRWRANAGFFRTPARRTAAYNARLVLSNLLSLIIVCLTVRTETRLSHASSNWQWRDQRCRVQSASAHQPSQWCPMVPPPTTAHSPTQIFQDLSSDQ